MRLLIAFLSLLFLNGEMLHAQEPIKKILKQINVLNSNEFSYNYSVQLIDLNTGVSVDSNLGKMYRSGRMFLDSNRDFYTAVNNEYYCRLDKAHGTATVYDLSVLKEKLNSDLIPNRGNLNILDSIAFRPGSLKIDSGASWLKIGWALERGRESSFTIFLDKATYRLLMVRIEALEYDEVHPVFKRVCSIYDISSQVPADFINLTSVFRREGNQIALTPKYKSFTINSLVN